MRPPSTPSAYWERYEYLPGTYGVVDKIKDALANATTYKLGGGRVAAVIDPLGNTSRVTHDRFGLLTRSVDPLGRTTTTTYDNYHRKKKVTAPEGDSADYVYDARSNLTQTTAHAKPVSLPNIRFFRDDASSVAMMEAAEHG